MVTDKIFDDFLKFVEKEKFVNKLTAFQIIDGLSKDVNSDEEFVSVSKSLEKTKGELATAVLNDLKSHKKLISTKLRKEILSKKLNDTDVFTNSYQDDIYVQAALDYLTAQAEK